VDIRIRAGEVRLGPRERVTDDLLGAVKSAKGDLVTLLGRDYPNAEAQIVDMFNRLPVEERARRLVRLNPDIADRLDAWPRGELRDAIMRELRPPVASGSGGTV
jgi:hypothetical protein